MRYLLGCMLAITLVGCATQPRQYNDGVGKRPLYLTLYPDGTYFLRHEGTAPYPNPDERGLWFDLTNETITESLSHGLVALKPHDEAKTVRFASVNEEPSAFGNLRLFDNLRSAYAASSDVSNVQLDKQAADEAANPPARDTAGNSRESGEKMRQRRKEIRAVLDPGPLSREEYRKLTQPPYSREPFLENEMASKAYFNGFRRGFALKTREPGQLASSVRLSGSMIDAARDAGFSAGLLGYLSELSDTEREEVDEWKQKYKEASVWPYKQNAKLENDLKIRAALEQLDAIKETE